jgi:hypothetical protein
MSKSLLDILDWTFDIFSRTLDRADRGSSYRIATVSADDVSVSVAAALLRRTMVRGVQ